MECETRAPQDWHKDRVNKAKFNNALSTSKSRVMSLMRDNDDIVRLLQFMKPDALDEKNKITSKIRKDLFSQFYGNTNQRVFLSSFDSETVKEQRAEVHISMGQVAVEDHSMTKIPVMIIDIIVATDVNDLDDEITKRHDLLYQKICDTIEGYSVGTVGYLEMLNANEGVLKNNTHSVWSVKFKVGVIKT